MLEDARRQAIDRMIQKQQQWERTPNDDPLSSENRWTKMSEVIAYGTAVVIEEE